MAPEERYNLAEGIREELPDGDVQKKLKKEDINTVKLRCWIELLAHKLREYGGDVRKAMKRTKAKETGADIIYCKVTKTYLPLVMSDAGEKIIAITSPYYFLT